MKQKVKARKRVEREEAIAYLEDFVASLRDGSVAVESGDKAIVLTPSGAVSVEVSASRKGEKEKFSLSFSWRLPAEDEADFRISSDDIEERLEEETEESEEEEEEEEAEQEWDSQT